MFPFDKDSSFYKVFNTNIIGMVLLNSKQQFIELNQYAQQLTGYSNEELAGKTSKEIGLLDNETQKKRDEVWVNIKEKGFIRNVETTIIHKDGYLKHVSFSIESLTFKSGLFWLVTIQDVSSSKDAENQLRKAYQKLSGHLGNSPLGIVEYDTNLTVLQWSSRCEEMFKWKASEILENNIGAFNLIYKEDMEAGKKIAEDLLSGKVDGNISYNRNYTKDGDILSCVWYNSTIKDSTGKVISVMSLVQDITEIKKMEEDLKEQSNRLELATEAAKLGVFDWDVEKDKMIWNKYMHEIHRTDPSGFKNDLNAWISSIYKDDREAVKKMIFENMDSKSPLRVGYRVMDDQGIPTVIDAYLIFINQKDRSRSIIGVCHDISYRVNYENRLAKEIIQAQENERHEIGQELHDNVIQILVASLFNLNSISDLEIKAIDRAKKNTLVAIDEIRKLSHQLIPDIAYVKESALDSSIKAILDNLNIDSKIKINYESEIDDSDLDQELTINLIRILQEQFTNILKYSKATEVDVTLFKDPHKIILTTKDNGVGFNLDNTSRGIGLKNMRRRVEIFNGTLDITTSEGKGCMHRICIPLG